MPTGTGSSSGRATVRRDWRLEVQILSRVPADKFSRVSWLPLAAGRDVDRLPFMFLLSIRPIYSEVASSSLKTPLLRLMSGELT